jgi:pyruvate-formate lyase-activating enzyme
MKPPNLVVSDAAGNVFDVPQLSMAGASLDAWAPPDEHSLVPLPRSSLVFTLPSHIPVGFDGQKKVFVVLREYGGRPVYAAAAFMPPGYVCTRHPAYEAPDGAPRLPLYCYAAVGWKNGRFYAAGHRIDRKLRHEIPDSALAAIDERARVMRARHPRNRLVGHLVDNCVLTYRCPNACNLVLGRWECPVPVSRACNAACIGCISHQRASSRVPSTQHRIDFTPTTAEIADYVVPHLQHASSPIASFGQGCEGEPLLEADLLEDSIRAIRSATCRGVINLNTNASLPRAVERLCRAGLSSMRVSLNSAQAGFYRAYYRPRGYSFDDVRESLRIAKRHGLWVSLNYLVFPGFTDHPAEISALRRLVRAARPRMIQTRNLNIDPAWYRSALGLDGMPRRSIGMAPWIAAMRREFPDVKLGYFNPTGDMIGAARF